MTESTEKNIRSLVELQSEPNSILTFEMNELICQTKIRVYKC